MNTDLSPLVLGRKGRPLRVTVASTFPASPAECPYSDRHGKNKGVICWSCGYDPWDDHEK